MRFPFDWARLNLSDNIYILYIEHRLLVFKYSMRCKMTSMPTCSYFAQLIQVPLVLYKSTITNVHLSFSIYINILPKY